MKAGVNIIFLLLGLISNQLIAQMNCVTSSYAQEKLKNNPALNNSINGIERFTRLVLENSSASRIESGVIKIPVVIHNLYHTPGEKISDAQVASQLELLNKCFRRKCRLCQYACSI